MRACQTTWSTKWRQLAITGEAIRKRLSSCKDVCGSLLLSRVLINSGVLDRSGTDTLRQLFYALIDLKIHSNYNPQPGVFLHQTDLYKDVIAKTTVMAPLPEDRSVLMEASCLSLCLAGQMAI